VHTLGKSETSANKVNPMLLLTPPPPPAKPYVVTATGPAHYDPCAPAVSESPGPVAEVAGRMAVLCACVLVASQLALAAVAGGAIDASAGEGIGVPLALVMFVTLLAAPPLALMGLALGLVGLLWRRGRRAALRGFGLSGAALAASLLAWIVALAALAPLD
jgi:hypothetical protein